MQRKVPAEKASAIAVHEPAEIGIKLRVPTQNRATPQGIIRANARFTTCV